MAREASSPCGVRTSSVFCVFRGWRWGCLHGTFGSIARVSHVNTLVHASHVVRMVDSSTRRRSLYCSELQAHLRGASAQALSCSLAETGAHRSCPLRQLVGLLLGWDG